MNKLSKKVCNFALLSTGSIVALFICIIVSIYILICMPGYLRGVQPYKILFFISKYFILFAPFLAVIFGHLAKHKIKNNPHLLSGKFLATIGIVLGYIFFSLVLIVYIFSSPIITCRNGVSMKTRSTINGLEIALNRYKEDIGHLPAGTSKDISNELTGYRDSPSKPDDIYLNSSEWRGAYVEGCYFKNSQRNQEIIDPWKKPYNFDFKNDEIIIWSCGPNRINENRKGDDISNKN